MKIACFITGTDTEVGKTRVTAAIMAALKSKGLTVTGMKPVASGSTVTADGLRNEDALLIQSLCSRQPPYHDVNPYAFKQAIAPHIAAANEGITIQTTMIKDAFTRLTRAVDAVIVEGVGGWRIPLNTDEYLGDLVKSLQLPVLLVVGLRLGCINHALLSAEAIESDGVRLMGWVANQLQEEYIADDTIDTLGRRINAPYIGYVPFLATPDILNAAQRLNLDLLVNTA